MVVKDGLVRLEGAVDLHIHAAPGLAKRPYDDIQTARAAAEAGMAAIVLKDHFESTVSRAYYAAKAVPGINVFGGLVLNRYSGGVNPAAAEAALITGARQIWMPTVDSALHREAMGSTGTYEQRGRLTGPPLAKSSRHFTEGEGFRVLETGKLTESAKEIVRLVKEYDAILGSGHLYDHEVLALAEFARSIGFGRLLVTHANWTIVTRISVDDLRRLAELGAFIELCAAASYPPSNCLTIEATVEWIRRIGPDRCAIATDAGNPFYPIAPELLRAFLQNLYAAGVPAADLRMMVADNPRQLLNL